MNRPDSLADFEGIDDRLVDRLRDAGIEAPADVAAASFQRLRSVAGVSKELARDLKRQAGRPMPNVQPTTGRTLELADWTITERQASYIESLGIADADAVIDQSAFDLREELIPFEPIHFPLFRRVCGRVMAIDPESGERRPVPNATVTVYDTDTSFLGYFPVGSRFSWFYPFGSHRERIGQTRTDECGRFCVYVPWWEIDRVLRFRRELVCLPEIVKPRIEDLLRPLERRRIDPVGPRPIPFEARDLSIDFESTGRFEYVENLLDRDLAGELETLSGERSFGEPRGRLGELLRRPAFTEPVAPPLPAELLDADDWRELEEYELGVDPAVLARIDRHRVIGPLLRCRDVFVPEWETVYDVPDITFEVTQDTDGDGEQETIYSEGYFDIRWDDIPEEVELLADPTARTVASCRAPDDDLFVCETPSIVSAMDMALRDPYHETDSAATSVPAGGYQRLVNRPKAPDGSRPAVGEAPYAGTLQLHGCSRVGGTTHYRVVYRYKPDVDASDWSAVQPFTGLHWHVPTLFDIDPYPVEPGVNGWYENLTVQAIENHYGRNFAADEPQDILVFPYLLLQWPTNRYPNGRYDLRVEVGTMDESGGMGDVQTSDWMPMVVDNAGPVLRIDSLEWWSGDDTDASAESLLPAAGDDTEAQCPVIRRKREPVCIRVGYHVSSPHFRNMSLRILGCSSSSGPAPQNPSIKEPGGAGSGSDTVYSYWHENVNDLTRTGEVTFLVDETDPDGSYTVDLRAATRAYNPGARPDNPDWNADKSVRSARKLQGIAIVTETTSAGE